MTLNTLSSGKKKARKRICRGIGSGKGKTGGRGVKGQKSRSNVSIKGFEGGQMPIHRRLPKRGFNNIHREEVIAINVGLIQQAINAKTLKAGALDKETLQKAGIIRDASRAVKILGNGELTAKVTLSVDAASKGAIQIIEKAGGKVELPAAA